ncbi:MAG: hypothetical protein ACIARR_13625 [Phycisphaerales bacterium JB059]
MSRVDRGARVRKLRLIGAHTNDEWSAPVGDDPVQTIRMSAEWVRDRLVALSERNGRSGRVLDSLCLDADGAVCSWVGAGQGERQVVRALIEGGVAEEGHVGAASRFPDLPGETELEPLDEESPGRVGVMAVPDVPARLLMDHLDAMGVRIGGVTTLWHAMAQAWDPGASEESGGLRTERVVASDAPLTGVVLVDPSEGRCVWVWSDAGRPIAAGSMRIGEARTEEVRATMTAPDVARLGLEWISWSAQLGRTPGRVVVVGACGEADASVEGALDGAGLGRAITEACAGASVDLLDASDPVGETLTRLAERREGQSVVRGGLEDLARRPLRAHRGMYVWAGVAMLLGAAGAGVLAKALWDKRGELNEQIEAAKTNRQEILAKTDLSPAEYAGAHLVLPGKIAALRGGDAPAEPIMPVLQEFETLSYVLSNEEWDLVTLSVRPTAVSVRVSVPSVVEAEAFEDAVLSITGSNLEWTPMDFRERGDRVDCSMTGQWSASAGRTP